MIGLFSTASAADASISIDQHDKTLWLNDNAQDKVLNAQLECSRMDNGTQIGDIDRVEVLDSYSNIEKGPIDPSGSESELKFNVSNFQDSELGKYFIRIGCSDSTTSVKEFYVDKMNVELKADDEVLFMGTEDQIDVSITSSEDKINYNDIAEVSLYLGSGSDRIEIGDEKINFGETTTVRVEEVPTSFASSDNIQLESVVNYREKQDEVPWTQSSQEQIGIKRWDKQVNFKPGQRITSEQIAGLNVSMRLSYEGEAVDELGARHFYLERGEQTDSGDYEWFSGGLRRTTEDSRFGIYSLKLEKMPQLDDSGDHELEIYFDHEKYGKQEIGTVYIEKKFNFNGRVSDSDRRAVDAVFTMDSENYFEQFSTDSRGRYNRRIMPGEYGFDIDFQQGSLSLSEVEIERNYSAEINYEYFSDPSTLDLNVKGIEPINMMAASFGYPFDQGRAKMRYNPAKTEDPMDVTVYECVEWNFWGQECISGWDEIDDEDVTLPPTKWIADFPVTPAETEEYGDDKNVLYSAYMVGKIAGMRVSGLGLNDYKVAVDKEFTVSGNVVTDGADLENADVEVSILSNGRTVTKAAGKTNGDGRFEVDMSVDEPGNFTVKVNAEKGSYEPFQVEMDDEIWIYRESDLGMEVPSQLQVTPGEISTAELKINNEGQTDFENVKLSADGPTLTSFSKSSFSTINAGSSEEVQMNITLPSDFCENGCSKYPQYEITLQGSSENANVNEDYSLQTQIKREETNTGGSQTEETSSTDDTTDTRNSDDFNVPSADFIQNQSSLNIALGLIVVFSLALAGAVKKKKKDDSDGRGGVRDQRMMNLQRPQVAPSTDIEEDSKIKAVAQGIAGESEAADEDNIDELAEALDKSEADKQLEQSNQSSDDSFLSKLRDHESGNNSEAVKHTEQVESDGSDGAVENTRDNESETEQIDQEESQDEEDQESVSENVCDVCGEEFDSASGLKLHKQAIH